VTHARDIWWTLDSANAFVYPGVNSRGGGLVPSHGASRRRLGDYFWRYKRLQSPLMPTSWEFGDASLIDRNGQVLIIFQKQHLKFSRNNMSIVNVRPTPGPKVALNRLLKIAQSRLELHYIALCSITILTPNNQKLKFNEDLVLVLHYCNMYY
jgi:hypothetical protein